MPTTSTSPWKGAMAIPRNLSVKKIKGEWILVQKPVASIASLRKKIFQIPYQDISGKKVVAIKSKQFEMDFVLEPGNTAVAGVRIAMNESNFFEIGYDVVKEIFYVDRSKAGRTAFNENFKKLHRFEKNIPLKNKKIQVKIFFDNSIAEVFVNEGEAVFTTQLFPGEKELGIELFSLNKKAGGAILNYGRCTVCGNSFILQELTILVKVQFSMTDSSQGYPCSQP